jgi:DDE family transposase
MNAQLVNDPMVSGVDPIPAAMATQLPSAPLPLAPVGTKAVELDFDGGRLSSEAGVVLLQDIDDQLGLTRALAAGLSDPRDGRRIHFTLALVSRFFPMLGR